MSYREVQLKADNVTDNVTDITDNVENTADNVENITDNITENTENITDNITENTSGRRTLNATQKRVAEMLVTKDIHGKRNDEIAVECKIDRATLYRWKQREDFVEYMNSVAETFHKSFLADTYTELRGILMYGEPQHKLKAIELMLRNQGRLTDKQEIKTTVQADINVDNELAKLGLL